MGHDASYEPQRVADGWELTTGVKRWTPVLLTGAFAVVWTIVTLVLVAIGLRQGGFVLLAFAAAFAVADILVWVAFVKAYRVGKEWGDAVLVLSKWPVRLGETTHGWFHRTALGDNSMADHVTARLILRESATYRVGTDTKTATEDVATVPLEVIPQEREGRPGVAFEFTIPGEGPPTIELQWNLVEWLMIFNLSEAGAPDVVSTLPVRVAPEVAR